MTNTSIEPGLRLSSPPDTASPLRYYVEHLQEGFYLPQVYALEDSPYASVAALLRIIESSPFGPEFARLAQAFQQHEALILGWDESQEPRSLVIAVNAIGGQGGLRLLWEQDT